MTVRISKPEFNLREKLGELDKPTGLKGNELMRSDTSQDARDLISAGRKNLIINGSLAVAQRGTSVSAQSFSTASYPVCDRWQLRSGGLDQANFDVSQQNDAPRGVCTKSIKVDVNVAESALSSGEYLWMAQTIEAQNCSDLGFGDSGASDLTISFYVKSNVIGKYTVYFYTQDPNRYITRTYTIDTSGQWERKIIHIPGDTNGNAIVHDNGIGLKIYWYLLAGSDYTSTDSSQSWATYSGNGTAYGHEVNIATSTSNYWQLTGVQVERGSNATEFENRSFGEELALCQRYAYRLGGLSKQYQVVGNGFIGLNSSTKCAKVLVDLPTTMRTNPSVSVIGTDAFWGHTGAAFSDMTCHLTSNQGGVWNDASSGNHIWLDFGRSGGGEPDNGTACVVYTKTNNQGEVFFNAEF